MVADPEKTTMFRSADGRFGVLLKAHVIKEVVRHCRASREAETGGILVGHYSEDQAIAVVEQVTGPPPDSQRCFAAFLRGIKGLQEMLNLLWIKPEKRYYLGEWHYHPLPVLAPSDVDVEQMAKIAASEKYACPEPILLIIAGLKSTECRFSISVHPHNATMIALAVTARMEA